MTKLPLETWNVQGVDERERFKVGPTCAVPGCTKLTDHAHHVWRRSFLGGDFAWVRLPDGTEVGNLVPLCYKHHELVTNNEAVITWDEDRFLWDDGEPLSWQPQVIFLNDEKEIITTSRENALALGVHQFTTACPHCKRKYRRDPLKGTPHEQQRPRMTWAVNVPVDHAENGYLVLEELISAATEKMEAHGLEWGEGRRNKYFTLSTILALFVHHGDQILSDG